MGDVERSTLRVLLICTLAGGGLWAARTGLGELLDLHRLSSVPVQSLAEPQPGPARLRGDVAPLGNLIAAPTGEEVVYYRRELQVRRQTSDDRVYWYPEEREDRWVDFLVSDGTSSVPVRPGSAVAFDLPERVVVGTLSRRTVDWRLEPGDPVLVVGMLRPSAEGLELHLDGPGYFHPLVVIGDDREAREELLLWGSIILWVGICLLVLAALFGWLVWGGMRPIAFVGITALVTGAAPLILGLALLADDRARWEWQEAWLTEHASGSTVAPLSAGQDTQLPPLVAIPALLGSLLLLGWSGRHGLRYARNRRAVWRTNVTNGPLPDAGVVAVRGRIENHHESAVLLAPMTQRSCVWYRYVETMRNSRGWGPSVVHTDHVRFILTGSFGTLIVDPRDAEVSASSMTTREEGSLTRHEQRLHVGQKLYALGTLNRSGDPGGTQVLRKHDRRTAFILSSNNAEGTAEEAGMMLMVHTSTAACSLAAAVIIGIGIQGDRLPSLWLLAGMAPVGFVFALHAGIAIVDRLSSPALVLRRPNHT